jgi:rSAM/selenodomain-associated transferase 1
MARCGIIVFLKAPRPGAVKTRLAEAIGATAAAEAYRILLRQVLDQLAGIDHVELRYAPDDARAEIALWARPPWTGRAQGEGDLGARLARAFADSFASGNERVLIIGTDCPYLRPSDLEAAWRELAEADVVLGPALDGGYWLIGLRAPCAALFEDISWSTSSVLAETLRRCQKHGLKVHLLRKLADVDTVADWRRFLADGPKG